MDAHYIKIGLHSKKASSCLTLRCTTSCQPDHSPGQCKTYRVEMYSLQTKRETREKVLYTGKNNNVDWQKYIFFLFLLLPEMYEMVEWGRESKTGEMYTHRARYESSVNCFFFVLLSGDWYSSGFSLFLSPRPSGITTHRSSNGLRFYFRIDIFPGLYNFSDAHAILVVLPLAYALRADTHPA